MDDPRQLARQGQPHGMWQARLLPPTQPKPSAFGRQGIPPARRFPAAHGGLHSRLATHGLGSQRQPSPGRGTSGSWQRGLQPSQTTPPPQQPLRERVDAALAFRQGRPASQQQCTDSLPPEGSQPDSDRYMLYDALQSQDAYGSQAPPGQHPHYDSLQSQSRFQLPERSLQPLDSQTLHASMHSDPAPPRLQLTPTGVPPAQAAVPSSTAGAATQCDPQAPAEAPAEPALVQHVAALAATTEQTRGELAQLAQDSAAQREQLAGLQRACLKILKAIQQPAKQPSHLVLHERAVQTSAGPLHASAAVQTSAGAPAQLATAGVQTSQLPCPGPGAGPAPDAAMLSGARGLQLLQHAAQASYTGSHIQQGLPGQKSPPAQPQTSAGARACCLS